MSNFPVSYRKEQFRSELTVQLGVLKDKKRAFCQTVLRDVVREIHAPTLTAVTS